MRFSDSFKNLFVRMIAYRPEDRITIPEILAHAWTRGNIASS